MRLRSTATKFRLVTSFLVASALAATVAAAQGGSADVVLRTGARTTALLRGDQPDRDLLNPDPTTNDPSIAHGYAAGRDVGGVNLSGVARLTVATSLGGYVCTGALIGPYTIVTAAHCVTDDASGAMITTNTGVTARFYGPSGFVDLRSAFVRVAPTWHGFTNPRSVGGDDVALIHFGAPTLPWMTRYGIYQGSPIFESAIEVGYGTYGNGAQGLAGYDGRRRWGRNRVDLLTSDGILWGDFDDGSAQHDAWCWADLYTAGSPFCDTGFGGEESSLGPGDSGGPLFIDGQLAGVASFATYFCDPSVPDHCVPGEPPLGDGDVPWGYGSLSGHAWIPYNQRFIDAQLRSIPEPSTVALVGGGLLALGASARGRRRD
jgi:hypothetical protein